MNFALRIYRGSGEDWAYRDYAELPVADPCVIVLHHAGSIPSKDEAALLEKIHWLVKEIGGEPAGEGKSSWKSLPAGESNWLHLPVCDGPGERDLDADALAQVEVSDRAWVMPMVADAKRLQTSALLAKPLKVFNAVFWRDSIEELAQVAIARVGVTSLDRRVFISYLRKEATLIADQLFDELERRNFQVFLDRVSIDPGVHFQAKLFEHLADKSMVVLLLSKNFSQSPWTLKEIEYARERRLSVIVLRLPEAATDQLGGHLTRRGEVIELVDDDLKNVEVPEFGASQPCLLGPKLAAVADMITSVHDRELIARLRQLRDTVIEAASDRPGITCTTLSNAAAVMVDLTNAKGQRRTFSLHPSAYPPGVPEMYAASVRATDQTDKRIVIGHTGNYFPLRVKHLEWVVDGRNVTYHDVMTLPGLLDRISKGDL
jgi:hypothetical protein